MHEPDLQCRLTLARIREAHDRIRDKINRTPVMTSNTLNMSACATLFFKCENFQKAGAFKARGATNAVFSLSEEKASRGVVTHSSGNHAAALSRAAMLRGVRAFVVMPSNAPKVKQTAVHRYKGQILLCEPTQVARERMARQVMEETGAVLIHAYDDLHVMAGQGTTAIEFLEQVPDLDFLLCAVGGGGILGGIAAAAKRLHPAIRVIGVEPMQAADAADSFSSGRLILPARPPVSIADGLLTTLSERTFAEIQRHVDDIVAVSEDEIINAMRTIWEVMKIIVEPSAAVAYAGVAAVGEQIRNKKVGVILTGGNLDLDSLPWQMRSET